MRNLLNPTNQLKNIQPISPTPSMRMKKIVCEIDEYLLAKVQNLVKAEKMTEQIKYNSVNELVRQALQSYQQGQLNLTQPRQLGNPRIPYSFRLPSNLYDFFQSWPRGQKTAKLESVIISYLHNLT